MTFEQLQYFVAEPPDGKHNFEDSKGLMVSGEGAIQGTEFKAPISNLPEVDEDVFEHWFYIVEWNSFIFVGAKKASFAWSKMEIN